MGVQAPELSLGEAGAGHLFRTFFAWVLPSRILLSSCQHFSTQKEPQVQALLLRNLRTWQVPSSLPPPSLFHRPLSCCLQVAPVQASRCSLVATSYNPRPLVWLQSPSQSSFLFLVEPHSLPSFTRGHQPPLLRCHSLSLLCPSVHAARPAHLLLCPCACCSYGFSIFRLIQPSSGHLPRPPGTCSLCSQRTLFIALVWSPS